jgi:hypothetical protein
MKLVVTALLVSASCVSSAWADCPQNYASRSVHKAVDAFINEARRHGPTLYEGIVRMAEEGGITYATAASRTQLESVFRECFDEKRDVRTVFDILFNADDIDWIMAPVYYEVPKIHTYEPIMNEINDTYVRLANSRTWADRVWEWLGARPRYPFIGDIRIN